MSLFDLQEFQKRCFSRLLDINRANFDDQNTQCVADELLKYQRRTAKHGNMAINLDDIDLIIRNLMAAGKRPFIKRELLSSHTTSLRLSIRYTIQVAMYVSTY